MLVSTGLCFLFPETKDTDLEDIMNESDIPRRNCSMATDRKVIQEAVTPLISIECTHRAVDTEDKGTMIDC